MTPEARERHLDYCRRYDAERAWDNGTLLLPAAPLLGLVSVWSTRALAARSGVSVRAINKLRSGASKSMQFQTADKLCTALGTSIDEIFEASE